MLPLHVKRRFLGATTVGNFLQIVNNRTILNRKLMLKSLEFMWLMTANTDQKHFLFFFFKGPENSMVCFKIFIVFIDDISPDFSTYSLAMNFSIRIEATWTWKKKSIEAMWPHRVPACKINKHLQRIQTSFLFRFTSIYI